MLKKVNPTVITLGIAGILAVAVGFYVNSVSWGPIAEEKTTQAASTDSGAKPANNNNNQTTAAAMQPTWAASATGRVEPKSGEVRVTAEVGGRIVDIPVNLNDQVKSGDLLVRLDDDDAITKVVGANAEAQVRFRERNE
jgi:HlyD family secretion protein